MQYKTKQQNHHLNVLPPATSTSNPPLGQRIDLSVFQCTITAGVQPTHNHFPAGTPLTVHAMVRFLGEGGEHGWEMGFQASSQHPVQVDQVND